MALATCGDDVFADDPTVNTLEKECASMFEKEAALFVPTGTMGNLISVLSDILNLRYSSSTSIFPTISHRISRRGLAQTRASEVILGDASHVHIYEQGGISQFGGVHPRPLPNLPDGTIDLELIKQTIRPNDVHFPVTRLLILVHSSP
eukprot:4245698-Pyramimonas_sp.AAC.1